MTSPFLIGIVAVACAIWAIVQTVTMAPPKGRSRPPLFQFSLLGMIVCTVGLAYTVFRPEFTHIVAMGHIRAAIGTGGDLDLGNVTIKQSYLAPSAFTIVTHPGQDSFDAYIRANLPERRLKLWALLGWREGVKKVTITNGDRSVVMEFKPITGIGGLLSSQKATAGWVQTS